MDVKRKLFWHSGKGSKKEQPGVMSVAMSKNIARPRQTEIDFDADTSIQMTDREREEAKLVIFDGKHKNGKPVSLTSFQHRMIAALSFKVTSDRGMAEDILDVQGSLQRWNFDGFKPIERTIDLKDFAKFLFQRHVKPADVRKVHDNLVELSNIKQMQITPDGKHIMITPLITLLEQRIGEEEWLANVRFGSMFFYDVSKRFFAIPEQLFKITATKGSGAETDLFWQMWNQLGSIFWQHMIAYNNVEKNVRTRLKGDAPEAINKAIKDEQRKALRYEETSVSIRSRASYDYENKRQLKRFLEDMTKAAEVYKGIGLITDYNIQKTPSGEKWQFWFNPEYNRHGESFALEIDNNPPQ